MARIRSKANHIIIVTNDGTVLHSTTDATTTRTIAGLVCNLLTSLANSAVRDVDPTDELKYMRIATKTYEVLVAPDKDFTLVAVI